MTMAKGITIGGAPALLLRAARPPDGPGIVEAVVLPGRGMMLLQATVEWPDGGRSPLLHAPDLAAAAAQLDGGPEDFAGNRAFAFGGALLAPFANRIRGRSVPGLREIEANVGGHTVRLPANWSGKAPGAEPYAMHGLILARRMTTTTQGAAEVSGRLAELGGRWPGRFQLDITWRIVLGSLQLRLEATNRGLETAPFGAGWHPYFQLRGARTSATLRLPADARAEVNNYDEVLPTGRLLDVTGTAYDFRKARPLEDLYLDDAFTRLAPGPLEVELEDVEAGLGVRLCAAAPPVRAVQVYSPPDQPFVVIEPQYNLPDPFGHSWAEGVDRGMVWVPPGGRTTYAVDVSPFALRDPPRSPVG